MEPNKPLSDSFNAGAQSGAAPDAAPAAPAVEIKPEALLDAVKNRRDDEVRALLQNGASVNVMNAAQDTPLTLALGNDDIKLARLFLQSGADVAKYEDATGRSLLAILRSAGTSFRAEEEPLACLLLDYGANPRARDHIGLPLVSRYASLGMAEALSRALTAGASANAVGDNAVLSPLYYAISGDSKSLAIVKTLIAHGADPDGLPGETTPPLLVAVRQNNLPAAAALLEAGANPDIAGTATGATPLVLALRQKNAEMADLLLARGACVEAPADKGLRAMDIFARDNAIEAVEKLLAAGAKADTCHLDAQGAPVETPLHIAVRHKRLDILNLMLKHGADPLCVDGFGYTPLQLAHTLLGAEDPLVDRLRLADGAARIAQEKAARAAAVETPPRRADVPPSHKPPSP